MRSVMTQRILFSSPIAVLVLAPVLGISAWGQQTQPAADAQSAPSPAVQQQSSTSLNTPKEGFWGRVNPFARKKWVNRQTTPLSDRLTELDQVNARNANQIQDVDARAQAGIRQAQSTADAANQTATAAGTQAQNAGGIAQSASARVDRLNTTVGGLDQYRQISDMEVVFRGASPVLSAASRKQLDTLAASLNGRQGYILGIEAHSPQAGNTGVQNSERMAEAVKRYFVTEHQIPVYRLHSVALGNAELAAASNERSKPAKTGSVHIRLMENSLAAQGTASPQGTVSSTGTERP